jgi:3-oxoacyl-[acyl-carrier protein] reductase/pteridine reductase
MEIKGKTALVTGGAQRLGKAMTLALAERGANLIVNYNSSGDAAVETAAEVEALGVGVLIVQCDVSQHDQVKTMFNAVKETFGGVDILINSASWFKKTPFPVVDFDTWFKVLDILLKGAVYCSQYAAPMMRQTGDGVIVNIVDQSAWRPSPGWSAHSVGKAALLALTRQLAIDLAPEIRVNAIAPGPVLAPPDYSDEQIARIAARVPLKRWGTPEDVVKALLFLVSSDYVSGDTIMVDGGDHQV